MAICGTCDQEMTSSAGCTDPEYIIGEGTYERIPYGSDRDRPCHDCAVPPGALHHPGCDAERCPRHPERQSISCGCG